MIRNSKGLIIFSLPDYEYLAKEILKNRKFKRGRFSIERFANQELFIKIKTRVRGELCLVLGSIAPPDSNIVKLALLAHSLKVQGAEKIIALIPYLAYARQDKKETGKSLAIAWLGQVFQASGVSKIVTLDVHSANDSKFFPMPLVSIPSTKLFAEVFKKYPLQEVVLVAPDEGAIREVQALKKELKAVPGLAYFDKKRTAQGVVLGALYGKIKNQAIIVDDMLDTGGTLIACAQKLRERGVKKMVAAVSHGLFTGSNWKKLWGLGVEKIYCTDSVPRARQMASKKIIVLPISKIISKLF